MNTSSLKNLTGRVALVTGGSRGLGRAISVRLAAQGARIAVHYNHRVHEAELVSQQIIAAGGEAIAVPTTLGTEDAAHALVAEVAKRLGPIDILVNNAGIFTDASVENLSAKIWDETIAVNLSTPFHCARACVPGMRAKGKGRIISLSSQAAFAGSSEHAHYAAAKAGLAGFTFTLARELGPSGITVNLVSPGRVETDMIAEHLKKRRAEWLSLTPLGRFGTADEIAAPVAFLASDEAAYITGANIHVNGGLLMG